MFVVKLRTQSRANYEHLAYRRETGTVVTRQTYDWAPRLTRPPTAHISRGAIQNGHRRPFCQKKFCIDMKCHFVKNLKQNKVLYGSEMARNAIECEFWTSKMADGSHFVKNFRKKKSCVSIWNGQKCDRKWISDIQNGRRQPFCQKVQKKIKLRIDLKWPEMRSKVKFEHPKCPTSAILSKIKK